MSMNAIEKAKKALEMASGLLDFNGYRTDYIDEALAALEAEKSAFDSEHKQGTYDNPAAALEAEKPAEDNELDDAVSDIISSAWDWEVGTDYVEEILRKYAHSYHLAECAKCKALTEDDVLERAPK